ncbi:MAG: histidine phosphatase family protein, partial [Bacillota bacterium]|nr:histidine phosphatase family protein [Bacillota bacterium]
MRIHIYRHGKTPGNAEKRYIGFTDQSLDLAYISDLNKVAAEPEVVYVTPLVRTQQTADILFPNTRQVIVDGFKEMNFGIFENKNYLELKDSAEYNDWIKNNCDAKIPNGEDKQGFCDRVVKAFKEEILPSNSEDVYI